MTLRSHLPNLIGVVDNGRMSTYRMTMAVAVIGVLFVAIFSLDVFTPLGIPLCALYVVPLALTSWLRRRDAPYWAAGIAAGATLVSYFVSPPLVGVPGWLPMINRAISIVLLWLTAVVIRRQRDMAEHVIHATALEAENRAHLAKEQALERQAEEIYDLYNRAPCGYHSLDATGRFVQVNETELHWLGYTREELVGRKLFSDVLLADSARRFHDTLPCFIAQGSIRGLELDLIRKDGTVLPVSMNATAIKDSHGRYVTSRSTIIDITERRRAEEALRRSHQLLEAQVRDRTAELEIANRRLEEQLSESRRTEEALRASESRFRLMADHAPVLIWISDGTKACTWFNKPWLQFVGRRMDQELGNGWAENVHPDDLARCWATYSESFDERREFTMEYRLRRYDGAWRWVLDHGIPRYEGDGSFAGYIGSCTDIDDRKRAEEAQARLAAIVESSRDAIIKKNKDLETLLYVTSHDLKEPLRAIEGFSHLLLERYAHRLDSLGADYLRRVVRATQRLDRLLTDILELSRAQRMPPPMEEVEAEVLVKEALNRLDVRIKETGAAVKIISPLPRLRVNRTWATQGLYNLLANALKFTCDGRAPDIEIAAYEGPGSGASCVGLVVKDRGPGVPPRYAERIFELFQRAVGRDVAGTGAGLAIVRQVAERHGGHAWVQPRAGGGSVFVITFACPTHLAHGDHRDDEINRHSRCGRQ